MYIEIINEIFKSAWSIALSILSIIISSNIIIHNECPEF